MKPKKQYCCIVDPYVSSDVLCDALQKQNIQPIAILTHEIQLNEVAKSKRFHSDKFAEIIKFTDIDDLKKQLKDKEILAVISGNERSCYIADHIAEQLTPHYANSVTTSAYRMDKFSMQEKLRQVGLNGIKQCTLDLAGLTKIKKELIKLLKFPVILKPSNQSGSFGVFVCHDLPDLEKKLARLMKMESSFGSRSTQFLVQEYIHGDEYFIDTVSVNGTHKVSIICKYKKTIKNHSFVDEFIENIDPDSAEGQEAIDFVKQVLTHLGVHNGMAHTEIFLTDNGPYLVELNPRISGAYGFINHLSSMTNNTSQAELLTESIVNPEKFLSRSLYQPVKKYGRMVCLHGVKPKILAAFHEEPITKLPTYKMHKLLFPLGARIKLPTELADCVAVVILANEKKELVAHDNHSLATIENSDGFFQ